MKKIFITLIAMATSLTSCLSHDVDNSTVLNLSIPEYMGKWYEIARFDHWFEKGIHYATANYELLEDGTVRVVNSGLKDGKEKTSIGKAKSTHNPGMFKVSFFGPFYSQYRVLSISDDYQYALVGSKGEESLWILSRTPEMPKDILLSMLSDAHKRGYDVDDLLWVRQGPNLPDINLSLWDD